MSNFPFELTDKAADDLQLKIWQLVPKDFAERIDYEIQDLGAMVLFRIWITPIVKSIEESSKHDTLLTIGQFLLGELPTREDEFRWAISLMHDGKVLDSVCGGWKNVPMTP